MPMVRAMRMLNAMEAGTLSGAQLETLLADSGRRGELQAILEMRGQTRRMAASSAAMSAVVASSAAMTAVAASSTAMTAVAASSAAMSAVVASSTAMSAIFADSAALNTFRASTAATPASVPTMTSDTAPSGIASASSFYASYNPYLAFDKNSATTWHSNANSPSWIQYQFPYSVLVNSVTLLNDSTYGVNSFKIQCSTDGTNWTDIITSSATQGESQTLTATVAGYAPYWRLYVVSQHNAAAALIKSLDFIGFRA